MQAEGSGRASVLHGMTALAVSAAICHAAHVASVACSQPGMAIPIATAITVALATAAPSAFEPLIASADCLAAILMQVREDCPPIPSPNAGRAAVPRALNNKPKEMQKPGSRVSGPR